MLKMFFRVKENDSRTWKLGSSEKKKKSTGNDEHLGYEKKLFFAPFPTDFFINN